MDEDDQRLQINLISALAGIIVGAIIVATYYLLTSGCCHLRRVGEAPQRRSTSQDTRDSNNLTRAPRVPLPPSVSYVKEYENKETCSVCLCDFKEGERIRVLPDCLHLFHVNCIDKWLHCHPNCPVCRAASSAPPTLVLQAESSGGARPHEIIHHQVWWTDD